MVVCAQLGSLLKSCSSLLPFFQLIPTFIQAGKLKVRKSNSVSEEASVLQMLQCVPRTPLEGRPWREERVCSRLVVIRPGLNRVDFK